MLVEDAEEARQEDLLEPLERIAQAARHLLHLINEVLDMSKIEAGRLELQAETIDLAMLLHDTAATARPLAERNGNRSEEHTSELQSLMRTSYAVFCLKKKNIHQPYNIPQDTPTHLHKPSHTHTHTLNNYI